MKIEENEIYTTKEVAEILKISMPTIKRMLKDGRLKSTRIGRQHRFLGNDILDIMRGLSGAHAEQAQAGAAGSGGIMRESPAADYAAAEAARQPQMSTEERRSSYMLGKRLRSDIIDEGGGILFPKGTIVTEETIQDAGRLKKLLELFSNLE